MRVPWIPSLDEVSLDSLLSSKQYRLTRAVARGTWGIYCLAEDRQTGQRVGIKVLAPSESAKMRMIARQLTTQRMAENEAPPLRQTQYLSIAVRLYDDNGTPFFLMPPHEQTLEEKVLLRKTTPSKTKRELPSGYSENEWYQTTRALLSASIETKELYGKVHGDIAPNNVFITVDNRTVVGDFGTATSLATGLQSKHRERVGNPLYRSPLLCAKDSHPSELTEVHAIGGTSYFVATGESPFEPLMNLPAGIDAMEQVQTAFFENSMFFQQTVEGRLSSWNGPKHVKQFMRNALTGTYATAAEARADLDALHASYAGKGQLLKRALFAAGALLVAAGVTLVGTTRLYEGEFSLPFRSRPAMITDQLPLIGRNALYFEFEKDYGTDTLPADSLRHTVAMDSRGDSASNRWLDSLYASREKESGEVLDAYLRSYGDSTLLDKAAIALLSAAVETRSTPSFEFLLERYAKHARVPRLQSRNALDFVNESAQTKAEAFRTMLLLSLDRSRRGSMSSTVDIEDAYVSLIEHDDGATLRAAMSKARSTDFVAYSRAVDYRELDFEMPFLHNSFLVMRAADRLRVLLPQGMYSVLNSQQDR